MKRRKILEWVNKTRDLEALQGLADALEITRTGSLGALRRKLRDKLSKSEDLDEDINWEPPEEEVPEESPLLEALREAMANQADETAPIEPEPAPDPPSGDPPPVLRPPPPDNRPKWTCANCGARVLLKFPQCGNCGAPRPEQAAPSPAPTQDRPTRKRCPHCNWDTDVRANNCLRCGYSYIYGRMPVYEQVDESPPEPAAPAPPPPPSAPEPPRPPTIHRNGVDPVWGRYVEYADPSAPEGWTRQYLALAEVKASDHTPPAETPDKETSMTLPSFTTHDEGKTWMVKDPATNRFVPATPAQTQAIRDHLVAQLGASAAPAPTAPATPAPAAPAATPAAPPASPTQGLIPVKSASGATVYLKPEEAADFIRDQLAIQAAAAAQQTATQATTAQADPAKAEEVKKAEEAKDGKPVQPSHTWKCEKGHFVDEDEWFCPECGDRRYWECWDEDCEFDENPADRKFCKSCGKPKVKPPEPKRPGGGPHKKKEEHGSHDNKHAKQAPSDPVARFGASIRRALFGGK